jgi:hypothetical protein
VIAWAAEAWFGVHLAEATGKALAIAVTALILGAAVNGALALAGLDPLGLGWADRAAADAASGFCATHDCIDNFEDGTGSTVQCADGMWSRSGGRSGACSGHGGVTTSDVDWVEPEWVEPEWVEP